MQIKDSVIGPSAKERRLRRNWCPSRVQLLTSAVAASLVASSQAATTYYFDPNLTGGSSGGGNGTWDTSPSGTADWYNGSIDTMWPASDTADIATFGGSTAGTVAIASGGVSTNQITFNTAAGYTLGSLVSGGTITLAGTTPKITANVNATISAVLAGGTAWTYAGAGTLTLANGNSDTGTVTVSAGALSLADTTGSAFTTSTAITLNGGTLGLGAYSDSVGAVTLTKGSITGTGGTLTSTGFTFTPTAAVSISANLYQAGSMNSTTAGGSTITLSGNNQFVATSTAGKLQMKGVADWVINGGSTVIGNTSDAGGNSNVFEIGFQHQAYVDIQSGTLTVLSNGATGINLGSSGTALTGALLRLTGGALYTNAPTAAAVSSGSSICGFQVSGGTASLAAVNGSTNFNNFQVSGGTVSAAAFTGSFGGVAVSGGSLSVTTYTNSNASGNGTFISGGTLIVGGSTTMSDSTSVSLSGGTVQTNSAGITTPKLYLDGGTIRTGTAAASLIVTANSAFIYTGGVTVDTTGGSATISTALQGTTGYGLTGVSVGGTNNNYFTTAPTITVTYNTGGSGAAATGYGVFNTSGSGSNANDGVGSIAIGNPGTWSTTPTSATISAGNATLSTPSYGSNSSGGLTKAGANTLTLSAADTYTGTTTVSGGTLQVDSGTAGSLNGTTGTALTFAGTGTFILDEAVGVSQGMGALSFNAGDGTVTSTYASGANIALSFSSMNMRAAGATANFVIGGGTNGSTNSIVLTGVSAGFIDQGTFFAGGSSSANYAWMNAAGTYIRGINYGTDANSFTTGATTAITGSPTNLYIQTTGNVSGQNSATFTTLNLAGPAGNNAFALAGSQTLTVTGILVSGDYGGATISGGTGIQPANNAELVIRTDQAADTLTITTPIVANGTNALTKSGAGMLTLNEASTYTGATAINAGTLITDTQGINGSSATGGLVFNGGTLRALDSGGISTIEAVTSSNPIMLDTTNGPIALGGAVSGTSSYGLTVWGTNPLTLTAANTYTGTTTVAGGTLQVGNGTSGKLNGTTGTALSFASSGTANFDELAGSTQGMGILTFSAGDGTVQSTFVGTSATLTFASLAARTAGATGNFVSSGGSASTNKIVLSNTTNAPLSTGSNNQGLFFGGSSYARYDTANNYFRAINYGSDTNAQATISGSPATLGYNNATYDVQITSPITAQTTASVNTINIVDTGGSNNITLTSGTLSVNGILVSGNVANAATISGGTSINTTASGNELVIRTDMANDSLTISTPIVANGTNVLTKSGAGKLTLSALNTYTGNTIIAGGTLNLGIAQGTTSGPLGAGTGSLPTAPIIFAGGTLQYSNNNATDYSSKLATNGYSPYSIDTNGFGVTFASPLGAVGQSGLTKVGTGTLALSNANGSAYTGGTNVTGGTLLVNNSNNSGTGTGAVTVGSSGTLGGSGIITGTVVVSGAIAPGIAGSPTTLTTGSETWNAGGKYTINAGTLTTGNGITMSGSASSPVYTALDASQVKGSSTQDFVNVSTGTIQINATMGSPFVLNISDSNSSMSGNAAFIVANAQHFLNGTGGTIAPGTDLTSLGIFSVDLNGSALPSGYDVSVQTDTGVVGGVDLVVTPEPSTLGVVCVTALGLLRRRRNARSV